MFEPHIFTSLSPTVQQFVLFGDQEEFQQRKRNMDMTIVRDSDVV